MSDNGFLQDQIVEDDGKTLTITNRFNTDELAKENYEERKHKQTGKSFRHVCSIPAFEFAIDPLLKKYLFYCEQKDGTEARKALRQFLALNPQYLSTDDKF